MRNHKQVVVQVPLRFRDIDAMGHVNNAVFFTLFEEGRKVFLEDLAAGIGHVGDMAGVAGDTGHETRVCIGFTMNGSGVSGMATVTGVIETVHINIASGIGGFIDGVR